MLSVRLKDFLSRQKNRGVADLFEEWNGQGWRAYLFGGVLRDLMIDGPDAEPRDIDLVVENKSLDDLRLLLKPYVLRETRFGGLHARISGLHIDVWPLQKTWAFSDSPLMVPTIHNLPKTTFLNIEGIVSNIPSRRKSTVRIFEYGFLKGFNSGELDINFQANPFPALAAARALITSRNLGFTMSSRLSRYVVETVDLMGSSALLNAQRSHYSDELISFEEINTRISDLKLNGRL